MTNKALRVGLTVAVLGAALGGLLFTTLSEGTEYYKHVDEVLADSAAWHGKRLQLHGFASDVRRNKNSLDWRFQMQYKGAVIQAEYSGVVPDTFKDDAEVVAKGRLQGDKFVIEPNGIMAKCPSKYEPKPGLTGEPEASATSGGTGAGSKY